MSTGSTQTVNDLIERLPRKERSALLDRCTVVDLAYGRVLCDLDEPIRHVYFPLTGFISLLVEVGGHPPLEMGLIGNEGVLGATLTLGVKTAPLRGIVQGAGSALRTTTAQFQQALGESPALNRTLNYYLYILMAQLSQTAACTRFHEVDARLARWLLMSHDRSHADHFHLTHMFLAEMLGVQRSAISIAAGALQKKQLIHYVRGEITILSREGLEAASCECYAAVQDDYQRLLG